jgi:hypothetical protein
MLLKHVVDVTYLLEDPDLQIVGFYYLSSEVRFLTTFLRRQGQCLEECLRRFSYISR